VGLGFWHGFDIATLTRKYLILLSFSVLSVLAVNFLGISIFGTPAIGWGVYRDFAQRFFYPLQKELPKLTKPLTP
jgi:hypothetical protein